MTISSSDNQWSYTGDGVTVSFGANGKFFSNTDLKVYLGGVLQASGYTVSGAGANNGGTVTFAAAPGVGVSVLIVREVPYEQQTDFLDAGPFPAETAERVVDRLTVLTQQVLARALRCFALSDADPDVMAPPLPSAAERAGKYLRFGPAGEPLTSSELIPGALTVSAFIEALLDDANAAAARQTLGLVIGTDVLAPNGSGQFITGIVKQGKHSIWVPAGAMSRLTTGTACGSLTTYGTQYGQYDGLPFSDGAVQQAGFWISMPKSWDHTTTVDFAPVWSVDGSQTGNVSWRFKVNARGDGDSIGAAYDATSILLTDAAAGVQGAIMRPPFVNPGAIGGAAESDLLFVVVERVGNDAADTLTATAILRGVHMLYTINKSVDN